MDVKEVLQLVDDLVFAKTDEHLDDLQQAIVRGVWQGQKYSKIAEEFHCTEGYVRNVASEVWQIISGVIGETVNKSNFRATIERQQLFIVSSNFEKNSGQIGNFNICEVSSHSPEVSQARSPSSPHQNNDKPPFRQDLGDMPDRSPFYDRALELATLEKWLVQERCRLVTISGTSGIGKSAIALQLITQIQNHFDCVIWRSLRCCPPLEAIEKHIIQVLSEGSKIELPASADERRSLLLEGLRQRRSLIILDDVQTIFSSGQLAGNYKPDCENYSTLFKLVGEFPHNSCFVLLSWEPPREITALKGESAPVRVLYLEGLGKGAIHLFREKGLLDEEKWQELIDTYGGNPLWLKIVATAIAEFFRGRVAEFLKYDKLFLGEELVALLHQQFQRLAELEKQVMSSIGSQAEPVLIFQILEELQRSPSEVLSALQSLGRRSLIEKHEQANQTLFALSPLVKQYVKTYYPKP